MPRLQPYDAGNLALQPSERGIDAQVQRGRRTAAFYNQAANEITGGAQAIATAANDEAASVRDIGSGVRLASSMVEDYNDHRILSAAAPAATKLDSDLSDKWNNTIKGVKDGEGNWITPPADPNDPAVAAKFREEVLEPSLQKFSEAFGTTPRTEQWSLQRTASMRNHFWQKTAADMGTLAAEAVKVNLRNLTNQASNAAFSSPDFHSVDYQLGETEASIKEIVSSSPNIKGTDASRLTTELVEKNREQIVKAAATSAIAKSADPEATAAEFTKRYPEYLSGADANTFAKAAKAQAKTNLLHDKQIETFARQEDDRALRAGSAKIMTDNVSFDDNGRASIRPAYFKQMLDLARRYPDAPSAQAVVHAGITWGEHQQSQKAETVITDPTVKANLYTGLFDPTKPTTLIDIQRAQVENKLSTRDGAALHQLWSTLQETPLKHDGFKETMDAAKAALTYTMPGLTGKDPVGLAKYSSFVQQFAPEYLRLKNSGTLPANALDLNDPKSLISQTLKTFKRDAKQIIQDRIQELSVVNMTGEGKSFGPAEVIPQAPGQRSFVPPSNWQWSASLQQYRDANGKMYDAAGKPVITPPMSR
jgi:hypothetical protein